MAIVDEETARARPAAMAIPADAKTATAPLGRLFAGIRCGTFPADGAANCGE